MKHLINKYKKNELAPDELSELRKALDSMTDEEVGQQLYTDWQVDNKDTSFVDDSRVTKMKNNIDIAIGRRGNHSRLSPLVRWTQVAATILLPVSILFAIYFYLQSVSHHKLCNWMYSKRLLLRI